MTPPAGSGETADEVGGDSVRLAALPHELVVPKSTPGRDVGAGGRVVGDDREQTSEGDLTDAAGQLDHRQGAALPAAVEHEPGHLVGTEPAGPPVVGLGQWKESPQAQEPVALGLSMVKPCRSMLSTKSMVAPVR